MSEIPALQKLAAALNPLPAAAVDGAHQMSVSGTVNIIGGGSGGTSMTDNNPFTPGSTAVTPMAGYFGGRSVASGNAAAVSIDHSGNLQVNVVAGGAGGGVANITVRGSANSDIHVGYASGAGINQDGGAYIPILGTVNTVGGGGGFASAAVYGSPANPVYNIGSVNVVNNVGVFGSVSVTGSVNVTGSLNPVGVFGSMSIVGSVGITGGVQASLAAITVRGSANTDLHVGYASGAGVNVDGGAYLPVLFQTGNIPSVAVYGSLMVTGSVNITGSLNPVGIFGSVNAVGSVNVTGSLLAGVLTGVGSLPVTVASFMYADSTNSAVRVNVVAGGAGGGVANLTVVGTANTAFHVGQASTNINTSWPQMPNVDGAAWLPVHFPSGQYPTVWYGGIGADTVNSAIRVNVVAGGAGGGVANLTVRGTGNTDYHVGYASNNLGAWPNYDGGAWMPVNFPSGYYPTANIAGNVGVFGSLGALTGSVNITGSLNPVGVFGSVQVVGSVNITGSLNPVGVFGSVNALASLAGIAAAASGALDVDPRANLVATQWIISFGGSGQSAGIAGSIASQRVYFSSYHLVAAATVDMQWNSPSGVAISGSFRLLPGAGFALAGQMPAGPVLMGSLGSQVFLAGNAVGNIGGVALGWIGT